VQGCGVIASNWMPDFIELLECGSLDTSGCKLDDENRIGTASISWHLKPTYKK